MTTKTTISYLRKVKPSSVVITLDLNLNLIALNTKTTWCDFIYTFTRIQRALRLHRVLILISDIIIYFPLTISIINASLYEQNADLISVTHIIISIF